MDIREYLKNVEYAISQAGWISSKSKDDMPTWEMALNMSGKVENSRIDEALEWARSKKPTNSYEKGMKEASLKEDINRADAPMVASIINSYDRYLEWLDTKESLKESSEFVGNIGDRVEVNIVHTEYEDGPGKFGPNNHYKMIDENGNYFYWRTKCGSLDNPTRIRGVIKEHLVYNGLKENILIRVKQLD